MLKYYDRDRNGLISHASFTLAMTHFNFIGIQADIETLYSHYDDDGIGVMKYRDLASSLYGTVGLRDMSSQIMKTLNELKHSILSSFGVTGYQNFLRETKKLSDEDCTVVSRSEFSALILKQYNVSISPRSLDLLLDCFDMDLSGQVGH